jgi:hypothetical protein
MMEGRNKERNKGTCERAQKRRRICMKRDGEGSRRADHTCMQLCVHACNEREGEDVYLTRGWGTHIERRRRVVDRTRGKLGKGDMEGKRVGRERKRGCGRKRKKESREQGI